MGSYRPIVLLTTAGLLSATTFAQRPSAGAHFRLGRDCGICHSAAPTANAMRSRTGDDVSPHALWQGTLMANSFFDPYFRAQLERETKDDPSIQELCLRCHTPMAHHERRLEGKPPPRLADVLEDPLAQDGVSCTVCHQIQPDGLGTEATFSGQPVITKARTIFGPFPDPVTAPMRNMVGYTPTQSLHVRDSGLCGSCHTLSTEHQGKPFPEQTPYLEWRNSDYSDEGGVSETTRTCQECHMADTGSTRIARNPMGREFLIPVRDGYRAHAFVGGNAFVLDLLAEHREELGVKASKESLQRMVAATKRQLGEETANLVVEGIERKDGSLSFAVRVENRCGHKFPSGYPSRRAWLHVQVRSGRDLVFESGAYTEDGGLRGIADPLAIPHVTLVESSEQVPVFELVATGPDGQPTTSLVHMTGKAKDTRILPRGWRRDGPFAQDTEPVGIGSDLDFVAGSDTVGYRIALPREVAGRLQIVVWLRYETIPAHWVEPLRQEEGEAARRFVRIYDGAAKVPETVAVVTAFVGG